MKTYTRADAEADGWSVFVAGDEGLAWKGEAPHVGESGEDNPEFDAAVRAVNKAWERGDPEEIRTAMEAPCRQSTHSA